MQAMNEPIEERIHVLAPAARVYAIWADVPGWPRWDPDTRQASLDGPLAAGAKGRLKPRKGFAVPMRVVDAVAGERFTVECPVLGNVMRFEHILRPLPCGVEVLHRVSFHGWLGGWLARTVGRDVRAGLPVTLQRLKALAEQGPSHAA